MQPPRCWQLCSGDMVPAATTSVLPQPRSAAEDLTSPSLLPPSPEPPAPCLLQPCRPCCVHPQLLRDCDLGPNLPTHRGQIPPWLSPVPAGGGHGGALPSLMQQLQEQQEQQRWHCTKWPHGRLVTAPPVTAPQPTSNCPTGNSPSLP